MPEPSVVMLLSNELRSDPRVEKEAAVLRDHGWRVAVLAWNRSGELLAAEERDGIAIERIGPRAPYGSGVRNVGHFRAFWQAAGARAAELAPTVVHCHDMDTAPAGLAAARRRPGTALVVDFHELYRESRMVPSGRLSRPVARAVIDTLERRVVKRADVVIVSTPAMTERFSAMGIAPVTVENAPDANRFTPEVASAPHDGFCVCYAGQKRYTASLFALADAVQTDPRLHARLAGGGVAAEAVARYAEPLERVEVLGPFTYDEAPGLYRGCDAVYAVYDRRVGNIRVALPVKALEGMACGLPVIVNAGTWMGDFVTAEGIGVSITGEDAEETAQTLRALADDPERCAEMGRRGRAIVEEWLNWDAASGRLVAAYEGLRGGRR